MEMGTGKSKVLIDNIAMLYNAGKIDGALIVAPKGVYKNWFDSEIPNHMPDYIEKKWVYGELIPTSSKIKTFVCYRCRSTYINYECGGIFY